MLAVASALAVAVVACEQAVPTAVDETPLPEAPLTVEIEIPWSDFGSDLQVVGGFSSPAFLPAPVVARAYEGVLEARTLMRWDTFPPTVRVMTDGGVVTDDSLHFVAGFVTLGFDTLTSVVPSPATLEIGTLEEEWNFRTATWTLAVDTVADQRAWSEAGAGPAPLVATRVWDPAASDSVIFSLDSAEINEWVDPSDQGRGARVLTTTDGTLLVLNRALLRVSIRPSMADTIVEDTIDLLESTFVYDPPPAAATGVRVGGAPAWRSLMAVGVPPLTGPPELCAAVGCPFTPDAGQVSYAALVLTSQATEAGFQPVDSVRLDVRPVLNPATLPKSPLGASQTGEVGRAVAPEAFGAAPGSRVEVPITGFMRTLLAGPDGSGNPPPSMLALLSAFEPSSLAFATFDGPSDAAPPRLRMVLTVGEAQELP